MRNAIRLQVSEMKKPVRTSVQKQYGRKTDELIVLICQDLQIIWAKAS